MEIEREGGRKNEGEVEGWDGRDGTEERMVRQGKRAARRQG